MKVIITGGAGFIGSNAASRYLSRGYEVILLDNLSRAGVVQNLEWLQNQGPVTFFKVDIRNADRLNQIFKDHCDVGLVLHLAAQVAVTTSVVNPRMDFEVNALGTLNILESIRLAEIKSPVIYSSTNKVYGALEDVDIIERDGRYEYADLPNGISEERILEFHSPYGCSKGAADQYFCDYFRVYGLRTVVFRQSCVYGYRQFGAEDQGWVAWFTIATQLGRPIIIYGDGKQTRDILFIDDLLNAFDAAVANIETVAGRVYNIGGGPENVISLLDLLSYLEHKEGRPIPYKEEGWRSGDQRVYVSDIQKAYSELNWMPQIGWKQGLDLFYEWIYLNRELFK
jgi:CDP-paratose 2-epimerase